MKHTRHKGRYLGSRMTSRLAKMFHTANIVNQVRRARCEGWRGHLNDAKTYCPEHAKKFEARIILSKKMLRAYHYVLTCGHTDCWLSLDLNDAP